MRLKILLFLMLFAGILHAQQDTIKTLIITEAQFYEPGSNLMEITNMGDEPVQLNQFQIGQSNWADFRHEPTAAVMLPDKVLQPGESFFVAAFREWNPEAWALGIEGYGEYTTPLEWYELADMQIHLQETARGDEYDPRDSVSASNPISNYFGRNAMFIEQHFPNGDSAVVDQVMGVFDNTDGEVARNRGMQEQGPFFDVAGFQDASMFGRLIRKFTVKQGNLNFADARGVGIDDSEWIVVPAIKQNRRKQPWTYGNHGDYNLTANTLEPTMDGIEVDYGSKTITVPWGLTRPDGIMENMERKPGVMWYYHLSPNHKDSLSFAVATGDKLEVLVAGNDLDRDTFDIIVREPTASDNKAIPMQNEVAPEDADYEEAIYSTILGWPRIIEVESGMDTITGAGPVYNTGVPFALRADTLLERLDIPDNATMEVVLQGEMERADLQDGDILQVTAENGDVREYYIKVQDYTPNDNARLSSITWPDIPDFYRGIFGWIGDTIPNFTSNVTAYKVQVPLDVDGIPALVAKPADLNAKVNVNRATNLAGTVEDRTTTFTITAEDDTTVFSYSVQLEKEKHPDNIQPYSPDPFISEFVHTDQFANYFMEIVNPGNQPLDLSNYMIARGWGSAADIIQSMASPDNWRNRYRKYVPGYKWVSEAEWTVTPAVLEQDLNVSSIVQPGDVFAMGHIRQDQFTNPDIWGWVDPDWWILDQLDIQFNNWNGTKQEYKNPWGEPIGDTPLFGWTSNIYLFKILNDSVKRGLKPATDPADFEVIDAIGMSDASTWNWAGMSSGHHRRWIRKPEIKEGNPVMQASFGTNKEDSEWIPKNQGDWAREGFGWPFVWTYSSIDIGSHFMNTPTQFMSTVSSVVYKVSPGYTMNERIRGMTPGTTVQQFLDNIIKANEGQTLTVTSEGSELSMADELTNNDLLTVLSADSTNTSQYVLEVSEDGLSSNAILTSDRYNVTVEVQPKSADESNEAGLGSITGFEYGTQLKTILANVTVPEGAVLSVINSEGAYVPLQRLSFDTTYVDVTVNNDTYFEVIAEDGVTTILYQLQPESSPSLAFVTSDVFTVTQSKSLIENIPGGLTVTSFINNLIPAAGATMKVVDKTGYEREAGNLYRDDELVVTSANGEETKIYFIAFLPTDTVATTLHLAYLQSNFYPIDQVDNVVMGPASTTEVATFFSRVTTAPGATAVLLDADGNVKMSGDLDPGDWVKVTAADGKTEVMYTIDVDITGAEFTEANRIQLYPNPTSGTINISGLETGGKIEVFNLTGSAVKKLEVQRSIETISLSDQPSGLYFIVVSSTDKKLGSYKIVKE